ncbi:MAG: hypothetical protein BWY47_01564 [Bacteroidetes bacterium ADurb.Bin302]|nr:MAG: hypothetical protein BWY47_01564 [Bacteroidetes bacterium ADurb.Bin302]
MYVGYAEIMLFKPAGRPEVVFTQSVITEGAETFKDDANLLISV